MKLSLQLLFSWSKISEGKNCKTPIWLIGSNLGVGAVLVEPGFKKTCA